MIIIPSIDILEGKCVRLLGGDFNLKKIYPLEPKNLAQELERQGAEMIHVVDLDGAKAGKPVNFDLIISIRKLVKIPLEVGGGIRDIDTARKYLNSGIERVVIGTQALIKKEIVTSLIQEFGSKRIVVAVEM